MTADHGADDLTGDLTGDTVVFFHAHPDDESIFTGGTIARLAEAGARTVVVIATSAPDGTRAAEASTACRLLGAAALHLLGYGDAGHLDAGGDEAGDDETGHGEAGHHEAGHGTSLHLAPTDEVAVRLADVLRSEAAASSAVTLVIYDDGGIYAHPDHLAVHRAGVAAAAFAGVEVVYEATVDREYLHFVETHLVGRAVDWLLGTDAPDGDAPDGDAPGATALPVNRAPLGVPTVMVTTTIDVRDRAAVKRAAIAAHASQLPADSDLHAMDDATFEAVYGYEWFVRRGPAGVLDRLADRLAPW